MLNRMPAFRVEVYADLIPCVGGITEKVFFTDGPKMVQALRMATEWVADTFRGRVRLNPAPAPNSYGHLVCLGAPLHYSEDADPNITPGASSLDEAIEMLKAAQGMDFTKHWLFLQHAEHSRLVREVYPAASKLGGMGFEGPITSCALFRGGDFYADLIDEPEKCAEYLSLMTDSVIEFRRQINRFCGMEDLPGEAGGGLCDDLASMLSPSMWDEMVIPYWNRYYEGVTRSKKRSLHCEAVTPAQLPYIAKAHITHYQPSVAPKLTLDDMKAHMKCEFDWLLYAFHVTEMSDAELEAWLRNAIAYGPDAIRTQIGAYAVRSGKVDRIQAFVDIAEELSKAEL